MIAENPFIEKNENSEEKYIYKTNKYNRKN